MPVALVSLINWLEDKCRKTEVASVAEFTKSFDAFDSLLAKKRIYTDFNKKNQFS
jgi:hypothetical protein